MKNFSLTRTVVLLATGVWLVAGLLLASSLHISYRAQAQAPDQVTLPLRQYYLTKGGFDGNHIFPLPPFIRSACATGYHFASLWEIFDPSNLRYNTSLGYTREDSGYGPPAYVEGWVRTGFGDAASGGPGVANCRAWSSNAVDDMGTLLFLSSDWGSTAYPIYSISPWQANSGTCYIHAKVWCVQD